MRRPPALATLVAVAGLLASAAVGGVLERAQQGAENGVVDQRLTSVRAAVTAETRRYVETLTTLAAGAGAGPELTSASFADLTAPLEAMDLPGARGVAFLVPADDGDVAAVQERWRDRTAEALVLRPEATAADHVFTVLQRPLGGSRLAPLGLDLAAAPEATEALRRARALSTVTVSRPYELLSDRSVPADQRQLSFVLVAPVLAPAADGGPRELRGWLLMGMRGEDFIGATLTGAAQGQARAALLADSGAGWTRVAGDAVAGTGTGTGTGAGTGTGTDTGTSDLRRSETIPVADTHWLLEIAAERADLPGAGTRLAVAVGAAGIGLTALSTALVVVLSTGRRRAERRVEEATRELRSAQEEAQRQAGLLGAVMDSIGEGVGVVDLEGRFLLHNAAARAMLGVDDVEGPARWSEHYGIFRADGRTPFPVRELPLVRALAGGTSDGVEMVVRNASRPHGFWAEVSARPLDPRAGQAGAVAVFRDVTARRRDEARFRDLLEAAPDAIVGCTEAGTIVFANSKVDELFGYRREELLGQPLDVLVPDAARGRHAGHRAAYLRDPVARPMGAGTPLRARRRDGSTFPAEISLSTLESEDGLIISAAVRDISDRVRAQRELQRLNGALRDLNGDLEERVSERTGQLEAQTRALREVNEELEAFSYSVSHDLRAPLRAVDGFAAVLAMDHAHALDEDGRRYLEKVRAGAQHMGQLIDGLLSFSRLQRQDMTHRTVRLEALVDDVWRELEPERAGRDVRLTVGPLPPAEGDLLLLRHVVANLLGNAVKYTRGRPQARIEIEGHPGAEGLAVYQVRDNGTGFDMRYAGKLFTVFQRLHRAEDYEGTGIGLALTARIVHRHGGRIWADAAPDRGATFSFTLPAAHQATPAAPILSRTAP